MNVLGAFGLTWTSATSKVGVPPDWPKAATASSVIAPAQMKDCMDCIFGGSRSALLLDAQTRGLGVRGDLSASHARPDNTIDRSSRCQHRLDSRSPHRVVVYSVFLGARFVLPAARDNTPAC